MRSIVHIPKNGNLRLLLVVFIFLFNLLKFIIKKIEKISFIFFDKIIFRRQNLEDIIKNSGKENIIILGNSPDIDLSFIKNNKDKDIFTVNHFYDTNLTKSINPNYHMMIHRPYEKELYSDTRIEKFKKFVSLKQNTIFFLTIEWKKILGNKKNIYYLDQTISQITNYNISSLLKFKIFPAISNVLISASYLSLKMKYKEIYIHGYNLHFPIYALIPHYYDENIKKNIFENFDTDAYKLIDLTLNEWLLIKKLSNIQNSKIYSTNKTFLPIFEQHDS